MPGFKQLIGAGFLMAGDAAVAEQPVRPDIDRQDVINACLTPEAVNRLIRDNSLAARRPLVVCALRETVRQITPQLPMRIDDVTTLRLVTVDGTQVTYLSELAVAPGQVTEEQRDRLIEATRTNVCGRQNMRNTMSNGGSFRYIWTDTAGGEVAHTIIESC